MTRLLVLAVAIAMTQNTLTAEDASPGKIVIDASKGGGVWWFPQSKKDGFDPTKKHQGKRFADYLQSRGWQVEEVPRGEDITSRLKEATIVVCVSANGGYKASEVRAYRDYVTNGGKVLLLQGFVRDGRENRGTVAKAFGIKFSKTVRARSITRWVKHPLTKNLKPLPYRIGSVVTESPKSHVPLAYLDNDQLVMGIINHDKGKVVYLSTFLWVLEVPQPFTKRVIEELARKR